MAERRMFARSIVLSDAFLDMPMSARCLYFTLGMVADDDGFVGSPKTTMRMCGASMDDLNVLLAKRYLLGFESGVVVVKHWKINNYLQNDRHNRTTYIEELNTLKTDGKGAYTEKPLDEPELEFEVVKKERTPLSDAQKKRLEARNESNLPYNFDNKIRNAFVGKPCPICGCIMGYDNNLVKPTIQHNIPISMGGKHEISNISVICASCNTSIQNRQITPAYNTDEVRRVWECIGNGAGMDTQYSIGKDSIGYNPLSESKDSSSPQRGEKTPKATKTHKFEKPSVEEVKAYCKERNNSVNAETFIDFYESKGWKVGNQPMKDWKAAVRTWERTEDKYSPRSSGKSYNNKSFRPRDINGQYDNEELEELTEL